MKNPKKFRNDIKNPPKMSKNSQERRKTCHKTVKHVEKPPKIAKKRQKSLKYFENGKKKL